MTKDQKQDHIDAVLLNKTIANLNNMLEKRDNQDSIKKLQNELHQIKS